MLPPRLYNSEGIAIVPSSCSPRYGQGIYVRNVDSSTVNHSYALLLKLPPGLGALSNLALRGIGAPSELIGLGVDGWPKCFFEAI